MGLRARMDLSNEAKPKYFDVFCLMTCWNKALGQTRFNTNLLLKGCCHPILYCTVLGKTVSKTTLCLEANPHMNGFWMPHCQTYHVNLQVFFFIQSFFLDVSASLRRALLSLNSPNMVLLWKHECLWSFLLDRNVFFAALFMTRQKRKSLHLSVSKCLQLDSLCEQFNLLLLLKALSYALNYWFGYNLANTKNITKIFSSSENMTNKQ